MNNHDSIIPRWREEVRGPPSDAPDDVLWLDGEAAMAMVKRLRPELSPKEIEGRLHALVLQSRIRHKAFVEVVPPPPEPDDGIVVVGGGVTLWHASYRFDEQDLIRCFGQQGSAAGAGPGTYSPGEPSGASQRGTPEPDFGAAALGQKDAGPAKRGPKIKDFWPKVLGYAAGWLAEKREAPERQRELEDLILDRIGKLNGEAERSTVRTYAREMLSGYRAQLDDE